MRAATQIRGPLRFFLLAVLTWQAAAEDTHRIPDTSRPPSYEELSSSLVVNQLAILQLMQSSSNASFAAAEMGSGRDGGKETTGGREEAVGPHNDRVLELMEARQQQMLGALNATTTDMLAHNDRVLELMEARLQQMLGALNATTMDMLAQNDRVLEMMEARQQQVLGALNATTTDMLARPLVHNDTLPSLCRGNKVLYGTVGALEVVSGGAEYSNHLLCSWELNFPQESSVNLTWDYIDMEFGWTCNHDWVQVLDTRESQPVYGKKLCGSLNPSKLKLLNVTVHGTRRLLVSFRSDGSNQGRGFRMTYQAYSRPS